MKTVLFKNVLRFTLAVMCTLAPVVVYSASLSLAFDDTDDGGLGPTIVGTGTFEYFGTVADGTYFWTDLGPNIDIELQGGDSFSNQDILTPLDEILVVIFNSGTQVLFGNENEFGNGPNGGSIDFENTGNSLEISLSLEPFGGGGAPVSGSLLYFTDSYFGDYGTPTNVPIPAAAWLFGSALLGLGAVKRRKA